MLLSLLSFSCDAPRNNPLDPNSDNYIPPVPPVPVTDLSLDIIDGIDCLISWSAPAGAIQYHLFYGDTSWTGQDTLSANRYAGSLPGIEPKGTRQTSWITVSPGEMHNWVIFSTSEEGLLSEPSNVVKIEPQSYDRTASINTKVYSSRIARWSNPLDLLTLTFEVTVSDSDGTDSVWVDLDGEYLTSLSHKEGNLWITEVTTEYLPYGSPESIIGHDLQAFSFDSRGFIAQSDYFYLKRVFDRSPVALSPAETQVTGQFPTLTWEALDEDFDYTFSLQIVHISEAYTPTTVFTDSLIASDIREYQLDVELPDMPQYLLWSVWAVDEFGNRSRSRQSSFQVVE